MILYRYVPPSVRRFHPIVIGGRVTSLRYSIPQGLSVLRRGPEDTFTSEFTDQFIGSPAGTWVVQENPATDDIRVADRFYQGGHEYEITDALAAEIVAAGVGGELEFIAPEPDPPGDAFDDDFEEDF